MKMTKKIKLHLGCGKVYIPGFIHIDLAKYSHIDYNHNIISLPMFEDNSVDYIYCCHALEYFDRDMATLALNNWREKLKPGGMLRLAVPDFEAIVKVYQKYGDLNHRGILGPLYGKMIVKRNHPIAGNIRSTHQFLYHKTTFDFASLKKILEELGYKNIKRYDWRKTEHANVDDFSKSYIPHMDFENGFLISLNIEATK